MYTQSLEKMRDPAQIFRRARGKVTVRAELLEARDRPRASLLPDAAMVRGVPPLDILSADAFQQRNEAHARRLDIRLPTPRSRRCS